MSRKSVTSAMCTASNAFELASRRIAGQPRTFTSTARRDAGITKFTPTSSPALDQLLDNIRNKIILPAYLPQAQRKRIYSKKWQKKLQADPVIIEIDGEVLRFRHENLFTGIPNTRQSLEQAVTSFETPADFANFRPLVEGIAYAQRKLHPDALNKLVRVMGSKGRIYDIIDCARSGKRTGIVLDSSERVNEILHYVQMKAADADWAKAETQQALRWAEMVLDMLQDEAHQPKRPKGEPPIEGERPLARDPMVLAAPLHLAAALVVKHGDDVGAEVRDKVTKYARDLVKTWPEDKQLLELYPPALFREDHQMRYLLPHTKFVTITAPILHGLEMAAQAVVEPELAAQLQSRIGTLRAELDAAVEARRARGMQPGRGQAVYEKLYGSPSSSSAESAEL
ncbi:hypothetical protein F4778DRAFT_739566 [Xylariomycetidae sp. FL2044]|nr:hypothetical protein F4778DRAFT_739566 [Xylariomycetidae sp. FL2044]